MVVKLWVHIILLYTFLGNYFDHDDDVFQRKIFHKKYFLYFMKFLTTILIPLVSLKTYFAICNYVTQSSHSICYLNHFLELKIQTLFLCKTSSKQFYRYKPEKAKAMFKLPSAHQLFHCINEGNYHYFYEIFKQTHDYATIEEGA